MAQRENAPEWVKSTLEDLRFALVKDGFEYEKLGKMKMHTIYKLMFGKYKQGYTEWYRYEKVKNKNS